jgi:hypothetical protein
LHRRQYNILFKCSKLSQDLQDEFRCSNKKLIIPFEVDNFIIINGYFYYCKNYEDKAEIHRMNGDGKHKQKLES